MKNNNMQIHWYPGHMNKAKRMMESDIKLIDVVVELVDARIPASSKNPDIDRLAGNKERVLLLNKYDLADENENKAWKKHYEEKGYYTVLVNAKSGDGMKTVNQVIKQACQEKIERNRKRGILNRPMRSMVVGIPNVGKSTFINSFAGRSCTKTGNKPGVTKGKQWIRLNKDVELLDTPGILWPKQDDVNVGMHLAFIGTIKDELVQNVELTLELLRLLKKDYSNCVASHYQIEEKEDVVEALEGIATKRGCIKKGGVLDLEKAAGLFLDDFRSGKLGRITLERP